MKAIDYGVYISTEDGNRHAMPALPLPPETLAMVEQMFKAMVDTAGTDLAARLNVLNHKNSFLVSVILQLSLAELSKQLSEEGVEFKFDLNS